MTIQDLAAARPVLNIAGIARLIGMPEQTLFGKLRRGTPLTDAESAAIRGALGEHLRPLLGPSDGQ